MKMASQSVLSVLRRVWKGREKYVKSTKDKVHKEQKRDKCGGKQDKKSSKLLSAPVSLTVQMQVLWQQAFRKEMAGNADLLNGNLYQMSGLLISLILTEIAPV